MVMPLHPLDPYYQQGGSSDDDDAMDVQPEAEPAAEPAYEADEDPEEDPDEDPEEDPVSDADDDMEMVAHGDDSDSDTEDEGYPPDSEDDMASDISEVYDPAEPAPLSPYRPSTFEYGASSSDAQVHPSILRKMEGTISELVCRVNRQGDELIEARHRITEAEEEAQVAREGIYHLEQLQHLGESTSTEIREEVGIIGARSMRNAASIRGLETRDRENSSTFSHTYYTAEDAARRIDTLERQVTHDSGICHCPRCPCKGKAPQQ